MLTERRSQIRKLTVVETLWASISGLGSKRPVRIRSISGSAAWLEVDHPVVAGERVRIQLQTVMEARLIYVRPTRSETCMAGCKFDHEFSEEELKDLVHPQMSPLLPTRPNELGPCRLTEEAL